MAARMKLMIRMGVVIGYQLSVIGYQCFVLVVSGQ
jgi:hypothetical protein